MSDAVQFLFKKKKSENFIKIICSDILLEFSIFLCTEDTKQKPYCRDMALRDVLDPVVF